MENRIQKSDAVLFLLAIIGLLTFLFFYPSLFPEAAIDLDITKEEALTLGTDFVRDLGFDLSSYTSSIQLNINSGQLQYLNQVYGTTRTNASLSDSIPVYFWTIQWIQLSDSSSGLTIRMGRDQHDTDDAFNTIRLSVDQNGYPIEFEADPIQNQGNRRKTALEPSIQTGKDEAARLALLLFSSDDGEWTFENNTGLQDTDGKFQKYRWIRSAKIADERIFLEMRVQDNQIWGFRKAFILPKTIEQASQGSYLNEVGGIFLFLLLILMSVVYFIQRLRSDLMDLKSGLVPGLLVCAGWTITYWISKSVNVSQISILAAIIGYVIITPFYAGGIWALFSVGESLTREAWPQKLATIDTLRRRFLFPRVGLALFMGIALGCIAIGIMSVLYFIGLKFFDGYFKIEAGTLDFWTMSWPSLYTIGNSFIRPLYIVVTFCLFVFGVLKRRFKKNIIGILGVVLLWSLVTFPLAQIQPTGLRLFVNGLLGLLFILFYIRYDIFTVMSGAVILPILYYGVAAVETGNHFFTLHGIILLGIVCLIGGIGFIAYRTKEPAGEVIPFVPDYLQRIYERERIGRELEIARNIQITFLPRQTPEIKGLDIATFCLPAREVGGDYFDFIEITPKKLGIVIGDVSGKGISAAFYMTLTKGFLKSQAINVFSPRKVLINMNELFYMNAERGFFISMIYAIFDLEKRTLTYSRAGHNPLILRSSKKGMAEELDPPGIALGLESGDIFARTIEERTIGIDKKDLFLFYTDGLNEAQNQFHEEFGEERLMNQIEAYTDLSADALLEKIQTEIRQYTVNTAQHDDMTAVVVKII